MRSFVLALSVLVVGVGSSYSQDFINRVKALEAINAQTTKDLTQLKTDVAQVKADLAKMKDPFSKDNTNHPQDCGCLEGTRCTCGESCGCTKSPSDTTKNYTTAYDKNNVCSCGCIETGSCSCKNCNSPKSTKAITDSSKTRPTTVESDQPGNPWVLSSDGSYYRYILPAKPYTYPSQQFFPSGGGRMNSGCGSGG